jgi:hypothetical protein
MAMAMMIIAIIIYGKKNEDMDDVRDDGVCLGIILMTTIMA